MVANRPEHADGEFVQPNHSTGYNLIIYSSRKRRLEFGHVPHSIAIQDARLGNFLVHIHIEVARIGHPQEAVTLEASVAEQQVFWVGLVLAALGLADRLGPYGSPQETNVLERLFNLFKQLFVQ
ncbi:MAG TPA: hypothetical protein VFP40_19820 [Terriglobales bacterium]|nr:hypothetical protein [Terriglobales bacterium]